MMNEIKRAIRVIEHNCNNCNVKNTDCCNSCAQKIALQALQEKQEREDPQPLTIEELRQMDGEPVWFETGEVSINEQILGKWAIITELTDKALWITAAAMPRYGNAWKYDSYGKTWLAYKYKPNEG